MEDKPFWYTRFFVDAIFLILVLKIVSEMFTGIITDRFSNEREKLQEINHDNANCCFICGKSREEIERQKFKFEEHIHGVHSYLNYIFYIDYLHQKKKYAPDALSMSERQVYALIVQKDQE